MASKELESKQQLVAKACSYGSGKHREFVLLRLTRSGKRPVYSSSKVLRTVASPVVQKCSMLQELQAQTEASSLREEVGTQLLACSATQVLEM